MSILGIAPKEIRVFSGSLDFKHLNNLEMFRYLHFHPKPLLGVTPMLGYDFLIHAASPASPTKYPDVEFLTEINATILQKLISSGMQKVLLISAGEVYGPNAPLQVSENFVGKIDDNNSRSAYPIAKLAAENILLELGSRHSVETNSVRLFHTFGPGVKRNDGRSFADFIWSATDNRVPKLISKGQDVRTFLYLRDTIVGFLTILDKGVNTEIYNLGGSEPVSILEFAKRISLLAGLNGDVEFEDLKTPYKHSPNRITYPSVSKLENLGWSQETGLDETILRTLLWSRQSL
jgi:nucleoside-diphosphate-sugar epimerase